MKETLEDATRTAARGRDEATPARVHTGVLLVVGTVVAVIVGLVFLIYFLVK